jgi:hypothetical protein
MGVLADLYVSTPDLAANYDENQDAPDSERARLTGLTRFALS